MRRLAVVVGAAAACALVACGSSAPSTRSTGPATTTPAAHAEIMPNATSASSSPPPGAIGVAADEVAPAPAARVAVSGCPPAPRPPRKPTTPWHPAVLVPEAALPAPAAPAPRRAEVGALRGKGMWIWKIKATEGGDARSIVARARAAGLHQIWVRVGDSRDGFYAADVLSRLVPAAHDAGIRVVGWAFPYLYDPVADARWSADALAWRSVRGDALDGFSPDIETAGEGVALSSLRAVVYFGLVRPAAGNRVIAATVFQPTDRQLATYPYAAIAPYVDAFAPMVYWGCVEPGDAASRAMDRLGSMAPLHLIGQAYNMGPEGGRAVAPSGAEINRFLDVARRGGAVGASLWDWQEASAEHWSALTAFSWPMRCADTGSCWTRRLRE